LCDVKHIICYVADENKNASFNVSTYIITSITAMELLELGFM